MNKILILSLCVVSNISSMHKYWLQHDLDRVEKQILKFEEDIKKAEKEDFSSHDPEELNPLEKLKLSKEEKIKEKKQILDDIEKANIEMEEAHKKYFKNKPAVAPEIQQPKVEDPPIQPTVVNKSKYIKYPILIIPVIWLIYKIYYYDKNKKDNEDF